MSAESDSSLPLQSLSSSPERLLSLDVFRGLIILSMLIVNNPGDAQSIGYFWKHAGFIAETPGYSSVQHGAFASWWSSVRTSDAPIATSFTQLPIFRHITLADYVMPGFLLIIGLSMPYSAASSRAKHSWFVRWLRVLKRSAMLVLLGWILCYFRDQFGPWWHDTTGTSAFRIELKMDVLQLLGVSYLVARLMYELPPRPRLGSALLLLIWHWSLLRFWPQGDSVPPGTFTEEHNAVGYIYSNSGWWIWRTIEPFSWLTMNWKGLLSVPPTAATMLLGTLMGDWLRRDDVPATTRVSKLALSGVVTAAVAFLWAFDIPFNKDRWSSCYLLWCSGIGAMVLAALYVAVDIHHVRGWTYPLVVLGSNAIGAYFVSIMVKVLLMNTPQIDQSSGAGLWIVRIGMLVLISATVVWTTFLLMRAAVRQFGPASYIVVLVPGLILLVLWISVLSTPQAATTQPALENVTSASMGILKTALGRHEGGWVFTIAFMLFWWAILDLAYRRRIFWRL